MAQSRTEIQNRYDAKNCKHFSLKLNLTTDRGIIEKLSSVPSVQAYIKQLVRDDIRKSVPDSVPETDN